MGTPDPTCYGRFTRDCEWIAAQLRAAWPQVRRVSVSGCAETREPFAIAWDAYNQRVHVDISISGTEADLLAIGLVTAAELAALPRSGYKHWFGLSITRTKSGVRANFHIPDPTVRDLNEREQRISDLLAPLLASALWSPPKRQAA